MFANRVNVNFREHCGKGKKKINFKGIHIKAMINLTYFIRNSDKFTDSR